MSAKRVCLVEDDESAQRNITERLSPWYVITAVGSIREATELLAGESFDLVLLDGALPDGHGFELCATLRASPRTRNTPIIFLSGRDAPLDKMMGFAIGGDDYLDKPIEPIEARARIEARLRGRASLTTVGGTETVRIGFLRFDTVKQRAYVTENQVERDLNLTPFEFRLLHYLAARSGQVFNRASLMKSIMDPNVHVNEDNLYTHISSVRKKLGSYADRIESIPRLGYRFIEVPEKSA